MLDGDLSLSTGMYVKGTYIKDTFVIPNYLKYITNVGDLRTFLLEDKFQVISIYFKEGNGDLSPRVSANLKSKFMTSYEIGVVSLTDPKSTLLYFPLQILQYVQDGGKS